MMKNQIEKPKHEINLFYLVIFGIFVLALSIRIYGAKAIGMTSSETEVLLSVTGIKPSGSATFFNSLVIQIMQFLGLDGKLGMRVVNVFMGAVITTLPSLFSKEIGKKTAIIASLLFAFDPFGIANSIVFSGSITTILIIGLLIEAILHERDYWIQMIVLLLIGHGRGLGYFLFIATLFLFILFFINRESIHNIKKHIGERTFNNYKSTIAGVLIILIFILAIIFKNPFSNIATDISNFITGWGNNYQIGNYPIVYPFAILSYIPVALIFTMIFLLKKTEAGNKFHGLVSIWLFLTFAVIVFYPRHLMIDLVWVSTPFWLITSFSIVKYFSANDHFGKDDWPFLAVLLVTGINLGLNLVSFVYRSIWGLDETNTLLAILLISIFAVVLLVYRAYSSSIIKALSALVLVTFVITGFLQLSISARAAGSNNKPENEILWNGYFEGQNIVENIIENTRNSIKGTSGLLNVFIDGQVNPSVVWGLNKEKLFFRKSDILAYQPEIVISDDQTLAKSEDTFQGQEFISNSYPLWIRDPVQSFISTDYWNWFFFRNNLQYKEYNSIWINKTFVRNKTNSGAE